MTKTGHGTITGRTQDAYLIRDQRGWITVRYRSELTFDGEEPTVGDVVTFKLFGRTATSDETARGGPTVPQAGSRDV